MKKKCFCILMILVTINFSWLPFSKANVVITNNEADTVLNLVNDMSLSEQKEDIENKLEQASTELDYVQSEISSTLQKSLELDDKIIDYENEIKSLEKESRELELTIQQNEISLKQVENNYNSQKVLLEKRLIALYEAGDTSYLDFLLTSNGIIDFISNYYLVYRITEFDSSLLDKIEEEKELYEQIKNKYENDKAQLKIKKAKSMQMSTIMQNNKSLKIIYLSQLSEQELTLKNEIELYKQEEARVEALIAQAVWLTKDYGLTYKGGLMAWPVIKEGSYITSGFGVREHPITGITKQHTGIDISGGYGIPIIAAADGMVSYAGSLGGYGNCVIINHGDGISTLYGHGQLVLTTINTEVKKGDLIMEMGSTRKFYRSSFAL